jgi:archaellum component FlaC
MDNEHERLLAEATYDGHKLGDKLIREFDTMFSERLGTAPFGTVIGVRQAWDEADVAVQRMLVKAKGTRRGIDKIMVINQYDHVKVTTAENDLNQFKNMIGPMADQILRAEQQQEQLQAAEGPLQAHYQAAAQQLQAECGARAQQLQAEWGARAEQLRVQSGDPREAVERLKNQIKTYVADNYRRFDDRQLEQLERVEMERRAAKEERARQGDDNPPRIAMPRRHVEEHERRAKPAIFLGPRANQEREISRFNEEERARQELNFGMGRKTGRRGMSPKKSPRKTRKSPKKSPLKTRKSSPLKTRKSSPLKTRKSPKKSPRKTRKSPKKSPRKTRKSSPRKTRK